MEYTNSVLLGLWGGELMALSFCWVGFFVRRFCRFWEGLDGGLSSSFSDFSNRFCCLDC